MPITPSQTVGPFFSLGLLGPRWAVGIDETVPGHRIRIGGRVLDQDGDPVIDALIEAWQADAQGRYRGPGSASPQRNDRFTGFIRIGTDAAGRFTFETIRPGACARRTACSTPHMSISASSPAAC